MITRYTLTAETEALSQRFNADPTPAYEPLYNAAPTQLLPVMTQESPNGMSFFYWGAPPAMAKSKPLGEKLINMQAEALGEKPAAKKKLRTHRCLVPADGFFLWKRIGKKTAVPYRFTLPDKSLFAMAGFWEEYEDENNVPHHTFSVITRPSIESVVEFSERMPVIIPQDGEHTWLSLVDETQLVGLLNQSMQPMIHYSVSTLVNDPSKNDKRVIMPAPAADQFGNLTLFD